MVRREQRELRMTLQNTIARSINYETTIADMARRSERRAWSIAFVASLMALILAAGYFYFLPLKEKVPYLVMADAYTGTSTVSLLQGDFEKNSITASEAINRSNVAHFILARESGYKAWDKGRYKGVDHIVFVLRDPNSGELMVSQSRSGEGVELFPAEDYLAYKHKRGTKLYTSDPLAAARPLLQSQKELSSQPQESSAQRRADEVLGAISHELDAMVPVVGISIEKSSTPVELKREVLLSEPEHPSYSLYVLFYDKLKQLGKNELGYSNESAYVNAAASMAVAARSNGLTQVDHVILSTDRNTIFAVQGKVDDPINEWLQVDKTQVAEQSVQASSVQMDLAARENVEPGLADEVRIAMRR